MDGNFLEPILSGGKFPDDHTLVAHTRKGLPRSAVDDVARAIGMSGKELCELLPISWPTLQRYQPDRLLDPHLTDHLVCLAIAFARILAVFGAPENGLLWLKTPVRALGDVPPIEFLDTNVGLEAVKRVLIRIEHGVFS